jgi:RNA binding exosome subunit
MRLLPDQVGTARTDNEDGTSAMMHGQLELARERQQSLLALAAERREARRAELYGRISRQAERAERRQLSRRDQAIRLRGRLEQLQSAS